MDQLKIYDKLYCIIYDQFGTHIKYDENESLTLAQLKADSLDVIELVIAIEEEFDIQIHDDELKDSKYATFTIKDAVDYISTKLEQ